MSAGALGAGVPTGITPGPALGALGVLGTLGVIAVLGGFLGVDFLRAIAEAFY